MVFYKRKTVETLRPKHLLPYDSEVWYIPETKEYFDKYEDYLKRLDFCNQKRFICELTGRSCLTFFEALESEVCHNSIHICFKTIHLIYEISDIANFSIDCSVTKSYRQISSALEGTNSKKNTIFNHFTPGYISG